MLELSAATRARDLARMAETELDVLVVGGGITGAGVALDAAARGLSVGLIEAQDFAFGTSGRSSRLIHGGARYLRRGDVRLVYEALRERRLLMRRAPHLVRPLPFVVAVGHRGYRAALRAGLALYDTLAAGRNIAAHRRLEPEQVARFAPGLARPTTGYQYWDCHTDDARLVVEIVRAAARHGALVANRARVTGWLGEGRIRGATVRDEASGEALEIRSRVTVNATGVWATRLQGLTRARHPRLRPSVGIHIVLDRQRVPVRGALVVPSVARDGTLIFVIPDGPRVYAGTTDRPYDGPLEAPPVDTGDVELLLGSVERAFRCGLTGRDIRASWAGVRPLLDAGRGPTRDLARRHVVLSDPPGLIGITGGKLTTYRLMAEQVVDLACRELGEGARSRTAVLPLGLTRPYDREGSRAVARGAEVGLPPAASRRVLDRYGDDWEAAIELMRDDPALAQPVAPSLPVLRAELVLAEGREMALSDEDVLVRRTRLATMDAELAAGLATSSRPSRGP